MKTLSGIEHQQEVLRRIAALRADQPRQWGKMSCHQMVCHLSDAYLLSLGEKTAGRGRVPIPRTLMKWGGLYVPLKWPKGVPTLPEMEQGAGGTEPVEFSRDRERLLALVQRFSRPAQDFRWPDHPLFGQMSQRDWLRWGYLHADHHLRQFGA